MVRSDAPDKHLYDDCVECPINKYLLSDDMRVQEAADAGQMCNDCVRGADCTGGTGVVPRNGFWRNVAAEDERLSLERRDFEDSAENTSQSVMIFQCSPGVCLGENKCREGHEGSVDLLPHRDQSDLHHDAMLQCMLSEPSSIPL